MSTWTLRRSSSLSSGFALWRCIFRHFLVIVMRFLPLKCPTDNWIYKPQFINWLQVFPLGKQKLHCILRGERKSIFNSHTWNLKCGFGVQIFQYFHIKYIASIKCLTKMSILIRFCKLKINFNILTKRRDRLFS